MVLSPELLQLVQSLRQVRSPAKRMRVLARAWRSFKGLSRSERREVARQLGVKGFERIAETIGEKGGLEPDEIDGLLSRVEGMDASKTSELISTLRDPEGRRQLARKGLRALAGRRPPGEEPPEEEPSGKIREPEVAAAAVDDRERGGTGIPAAVAVASVAAAAAGERAPGVPSEGPAAPVGEAPVRPGAGGEPEPAEPSLEDLLPEERVPTAPIIPPRAAVIAPVHVDREGARPAAAGRGPAALAPGRGAEPAVPASVEALAERMGRARSLVGRLRLLRRFLETGGRADGAGARTLLSRLPEGWARRRALQAILHRGHPAAFEEALDLMEEIRSPAGRDWCLKALARGRRLTDDELARLCALTGSPIVERRLKALQAGHR